MGKNYKRGLIFFTLLFFVTVLLHQFIPIKLFTPANPSFSEIKAEVQKAASKWDIPPEIILAVADRESGIRQFTSSGKPKISFDGGIGIMQVTPGNLDWSYTSDEIHNLKYNYKYNIDQGCRILNSKWYYANNHTIPKIGNGDRMVLENWYFTLWAYNGYCSINNPNKLPMKVSWGVQTTAYQDSVYNYLYRLYGINVTKVSLSSLSSSGAPSGYNTYPTPEPYHISLLVGGGRSGFASQVNRSTIPLLKNYVVTASTLSCRVSPSNRSASNGKLYKGQKVRIYAKSGDWLLVNKMNPQWVSSKYVSASQPLNITSKGTVVNQNGAIFRENPYNNDANTGVAPTGTVLNIYEEYNGWYLVNTTANLQWVYKADLKITSMINVPTVTSSSMPLSQTLAPSGTICYDFPMIDYNNSNETLSQDKILNVYAKSGDWLLINNIKPQWINIPKIFTSTIGSSTVPLLKNYVVNASTLSCKVSPSNSAASNGTLYKGQTVNIYAKNGEWLLVNNVNPQWVSSEYVSASQPLNITSKGTVVNPNGAIFRENPYNNDANTRVVPTGTVLNIYEKYNGWYLVDTTANLQWVYKTDLNIQ